MILIADSGSSKTDWLAIGLPHSTEQHIATAGINPSLQDETSIVATLRDQLLPRLEGAEVSAIWFYGAGCTPQQSGRLKGCLLQVFARATCEVHSDLLGAARALCGHSEGIACILGTGSNSCYYDGERICLNTPALGFILGDEGSGAVLGKNLIGGLLKGGLPEQLRRAFTEETGLDVPDILQKVYRESMPNRFLAGLSPFIARHRTELRAFLVENFRSFFRKNIAPYPAGRRLPIHFTGSIACYYEEELRAAAEEEGYTIGCVLQKPIGRLAAYHLTKATDSGY